LSDGWLQNFKEHHDIRNWILVEKCCQLMFKLQNGVVNFSTKVEGDSDAPEAGSEAVIQVDNFF
jgi:hypothetical protein